MNDSTAKLSTLSDAKRELATISRRARRHLWLVWVCLLLIKLAKEAKVFEAFATGIGTSFPAAVFTVNVVAAFADVGCIFLLAPILKEGAFVQSLEDELQTIHRELESYTTQSLAIFSGYVVRGEPLLLQASPTRATRLLAQILVGRSPKGASTVLLRAFWRSVLD